MGAIARMGGAAWVDTPNGFRVVGVNLHTPQALINLAGLSEHEVSLRDVEDVSNFVNGHDRRRREFVYSLGGTYRENFASIDNQFAGHGLSVHTDIGELPIEVLARVLQLHNQPPAQTEQVSEGIWV